MKKKLISLLLVLGIAAGVAGCGTDKEATKETSAKTIEKIRLGVFTGGIDHYLAVVGVEEGIFEKHGIQLEMTEFAAGINTVDAVVTGQADIGMVADYALVNRIGNTQEESDIRVLARLTSAKNYSLYVNPEEITKLEDLSGKGLVTLPGTILDYFNAVAYEAGNIDKKDQEIVNVDSGQAALGVLSNGEGAAFWTTGTSAKKLEEIGMKPLLTMEDLSLTVDAYYVASDTYQKEERQKVEKFLAAIKETQEWVQENSTDAAEIIEDKANIPQDQVIENLEDSKLLLDFKEDSVEHLNKIKKWAVENDRFKKDYEIKEFVDAAALKELFPENVED